MFSILRGLWNDDCGAIISTEMCLIMAICGVGLIAGLTQVRNAVLNEMNDMAQAIGSIDQTYRYSGASSRSAFTAGSAYGDTPNGNAETFRGQYCVQVNNVVIPSPPRDSNIVSE